MERTCVTVWSPPPNRTPRPKRCDYHTTQRNSLSILCQMVTSFREVSPTMAFPVHAALPDSLVSTAWLQAHLDDEGLAIVDIRGHVKTVDLGGGRQHADYVAARDEFDAGHIPGAQFIDWTVDITDPAATVKAQLAGPERFAGAMEAVGIGNDTSVVVVDHTGGHFATRLWWALGFYGHDQVAVLDGGFAKWAAEHRPLTSAVEAPPVVTFTPRPRPGRLVDAEQTLAATTDDRLLIVDARDPAQYLGQTVRGARGGHIPSAVSIPSKSLVNADGTWKEPAAIAAELAANGVSDDRTVIAYCNGGVTATALLFGMSRAGMNAWANYDGSWNEWGERPELPVEGWRPAAE